MSKNEVSTKSAAGLPGIAGFAAGLRRTRASTPSFGGKGYLTFGKDGIWSLGKERVERNGMRAVLDVQSLKAGYVCWTNYPATEKKKNEKLGEEMRPVVMEPIDPSTLPDLKWEWRQQQAVEGRFLLGDKEEFNYTTSSLGGLEALDVVLEAILARIDQGETVFVYPVVELDGDWYEHRQYGKTYKPILSIVAWANMDGEVEGGEVKKVAAPKAEPKEVAGYNDPDVLAEKVRAQTRADNAPEETEAVETDEPPVRRRRR